MKRRSLLKGAAIGAPAALLLGTGTAHAAAFSVAATEQVQNKVLMWDKDAAFTDANVQWSWTPGAGGWYNLSDIRFRNTAAFGEVALVAASGGNVGIVDKTTEQHQELNDVLWTGAPGGNPHAIERIPDIGAIVSASSEGFLAVYGPTAISDPSTLARVQTVTLAGAHGVLWDPSLRHLWAVGDKTLRAYNVTGTYRNTRLVYANKSVALPGLGHDLQPDYTDPGKLLVTDTYGVYRIDTATLTRTTVVTEGSVKSWVRHASGEDVSVKADGVGSRTWGSPTVRLSVAADKTRSGAEFYKARIYTTAFE
ncbi:hypothetical protein Afil01_19360 [Actinorhabdospora filicis]|uniref:Twin-arginine translocation signal domain-containing protein n=1 Tax=Actinorhabdospora filicis TaxID=1785913 RepID=A0A9W6SHA8_9ACTN|nr:DUF6528 family protein [Actinorhabdospora filicis]GLZ77129.1 hypothetical protein Afil01_19360 [Actinorhabdospora filicis]